MPDRDLIRVLALSYGLALSIAMSAIFAIAFATGGSVTVYLNKHGEMWPEAIALWFVVWPTMTVALHNLVER